MKLHDSLVRSDLDKSQHKIKDLVKKNTKPFNHTAIVNCQNAGQTLNHELNGMEIIEASRDLFINPCRTFLFPRGDQHSRMSWLSW